MMMRAPSRSARRLILASSSVGLIVRGLAYMPWTQASTGVRQLSPVEAWMPLHAWGWIWVAAGILLGLAIIWRGISITAMSLMTGLLTMWGISYMWAWAFEGVQRSWVTGGLFLVMAVWAGTLTSLLERRH